MANDIALLSEAVYALRENFTTVAVDRGINFDKEAGFALQILSGSDSMMSAAMNNRQSVENAVTNVAAIGISLNPALKQAYLVVRKGVICLDLSYMGLIHLAISAGLPHRPQRTPKKPNAASATRPTRPPSTARHWMPLSRAA